MPEVHPTAILEGEVDLAEDVVVGPHCVVTGPVTIGAGSRLVGNVYLHGPLTMGAANVVYPFACLGFSPQHAKYDPAHPGQGVLIGDGNTFRESVSIHRAFTDDGPTRIGDRNVFMVNTHVGHDCIVGSGCTLANNSGFSGHVTVDDNVTIGGATGVHQFCRLGRNAMLTGGMATGQDVPPFFMLTGFNTCGSINLVGLRRSGVSPETIEAVRWVFRTLYRRRLSVKSALGELRKRADEPIVAEYVEFIEGSQRGICRGHVSPLRG